jgi:hypothetical protein
MIRDRCDAAYFPAPPCWGKNLAGAIILKVFHLPAENTRKEMTMKMGVEFLQRMNEDAEFRQEVNACPDGAARLAFLRTKGYDFTPFAQILDNLSSGRQPGSKVPPSTQPARPNSGASGFVGRLSLIFRAFKTPCPDR